MRNMEAGITGVPRRKNLILSLSKDALTKMQPSIPREETAPMPHHHASVTRRRVLAGTGVAAAALSAPSLLRAQGASIKVGVIHPVTGGVAYSGTQSRAGALMAIDDINKSGIKSLGGAKIEPLLADAQSKVDVAVSEIEK